MTIGNLMPPQGWQCPVCGRVYAPYFPYCTNCNNQRITVSNTNTTLQEHEKINLEDLLKRPKDWMYFGNAVLGSPVSGEGDKTDEQMD